MPIEANIGSEKFFVYSYSCLDQKDWNENTNEEDLDNLFEKYRSVLPSNSQILDDKYARKTENANEKRQIYKNQYKNMVLHLQVQYFLHRI